MLYKLCTLCICMHEYADICVYIYILHTCVSIHRRIYIEREREERKQLPT